jgi:hypothetical protein
MRTQESPVAFVASRMRGNGLPRSAIDCTVSKYVTAARAFWPQKTAENWAAVAGVQPRMVKYWLSGEHEVSAAGKLAIIQEFD